jgi:hypothetical protein
LGSPYHWRQARVQSGRRRAARDLQLAIQQLPQSPDFRRAASYANHAAQIGVPADFRQRQFRRLRALLVQHLIRRLQAGASLDNACGGLAELIRALGVAAFEAEYIVATVREQQTVSSPRTPDFRERLESLHAEHARRLEAIRSTPQLDEEVREQLLEAEQERFRGEALDQPEPAS